MASKLEMWRERTGADEDSEKVMGWMDCKSRWEQRIFGDGSLEAINWKLQEVVYRV